METPSYPTRSPWWYVPTLYFLQGLPVMIVQGTAVTMYKDLGVGNAQIGLFTSLLTWPWIAKAVWGPMVDSNATKRGWVWAMQGLMVGALACAALALGTPMWFALSLGMLLVVAFVSATHDIAADGWYMLALPQDRQAFFIGIRSAAFRLGTIAATGGLVVLAGRLQDGGQGKAASWALAIGVGAAAYALVMAWGWKAMPRAPLDVPRARPNVPRILGQFAQVLLALAGIGVAWRFLQYATLGLFAVAQGRPITSVGWPLFMGPDLFPAPLWVSFAVAGVVLVASVFSTRALFAGIGMGPAAREFFTQRRIGAILAFILFFRFGESMVGKMSSPFLQDPLAKGGLGLELEQVGKILGTVGVVSLVLGGLLGGFTIARFGIKRCLWPMVLALNIPNLAYVWAAFAKPGQQAVTGLVALDQFGYGFGFSAYMVFLLFICQGSSRQTSLYAIATGLMALGAMGAGILSGYLQTWTASMDPTNGYAWFFVAVLVLGIPGMLSLLFIPKDKEDLRIAPPELD